MRSTALSVLGLVVLLAGIGCLSGDDRSAHCTPPDTVPCACAGGGTGWQRCSLRTQTWLACECGDGGGATECDPGESASCSCADGAAGTQRCGEDGYWLACGCGEQTDGGEDPGPVDAGPADAGVDDGGWDAGTPDAGGPECFADADCGLDQICQGGLCTAACLSAADCAAGLVCTAGRCAPCTDSAQCAAGELCSGEGLCVARTGCSDADCQSALGLAYRCDAATDQCVRGCTDPGCDPAAAADCNPCPSGLACDAATGTCDAAGCDCTALGCEALGQVCDTVSCACTTAGGGGGTAGQGEACLSDADCQAGLGCGGAFPAVGLPGTCGVVCSLDTGCTCPSGLTCGDSNTLTLCMLGLPAVCQ